MATLQSVDGDIRLSLRMTGKSFDPFQQDLEWFEYELAAEVSPRESGESPIENRAWEKMRSAKGKINRKDFQILVDGIEGLAASGAAMRFEPYDLHFCFEWAKGTDLVFLIVTWFDLALVPRSFEQRFPTAHTGFRFLTDEEALMRFRAELEAEFAPTVKAAKKKTAWIN